MPRSIGISELKRHQAIAWHSVCVCLHFYISKKPIFRTPLPSTISLLFAKMRMVRFISDRLLPHRRQSL